MGSMLRRVSFQTGLLRSTYERFLTIRGMDRPARQMLALLPGLDAMCEGVPIWGMTSHEWLSLFSVPDREGGRLLVRIVPVPSGGYAVGYPVADATGATRESVRIEFASTPEEALALIAVALPHTPGVDDPPASASAA